MKNIKLLVDAELIEYFLDIQKVLSLYMNDDSLLLNVGRPNSKIYLRLNSKESQRTSVVG